MDNKWHYVKDGDYPVLFGDYVSENYPQIPCLVELKYDYKILYFNITDQCWDDEDADDFFCKKDGIVRWRYLDALIEEK